MKLDINNTGDLRLILETPEEAALVVPKEQAELIIGGHVGVLYLYKAPIQIHDPRALVLNEAKRIEVEAMYVPQEPQSEVPGTAEGAGTGSTR